jgi:hypothetical protein
MTGFVLTALPDAYGAGYVGYAPVSNMETLSA